MDTKKEQPKKFQKTIERCTVSKTEKGNKKNFNLVEEKDQITAFLPSQVEKWNKAAREQAQNNNYLYIWVEVKAEKESAKETKK